MNLDTFHIEIKTDFFKMLEIPLPPTINSCRVPDIKGDLRGIALRLRII